MKYKSIEDHITLSYTCPLCREDNHTLDSQRCMHCGMLMMSDQEYSEIQKAIIPLIDRVKDSLKMYPSPKRWKEIQPLLKSLEPYAITYPFVKHYGSKVLNAMKEDREMTKYNQMFKLNQFILFILILMPLGAIFLGAGPELWGLLCLPVLGWLWFGILLFRKRIAKKLE